MFIIWGLMIIAIGAIIVIKSEVFLNFFGRISFFEKFLGAEGGSRLGYKIIGILAIFIGILVATNLFGGFITWFLSPLINAGR
jgi:hypothetical protein